MNDIFVRLAQFDADVKGLVVPLPDGDYRVYINSVYNAEQQREILNHEIRHLLLGHHHDARPVQALEDEAGAENTLLENIRDAEVNGLPPAAGPGGRISPPAPPLPQKPAALLPGPAAHGVSAPGPHPASSKPARPKPAPHFHSATFRFAELGPLSLRPEIASQFHSATLRLHSAPSPSRVYPAWPQPSAQELLVMLEDSLDAGPELREQIAGHYRALTQNGYYGFPAAGPW